MRAAPAMDDALLDHGDAGAVGALKHNRNL
jgi:hypothetical protein